MGVKPNNNMGRKDTEKETKMKFDQNFRRNQNFSRFFVLLFVFFVFSMKIRPLGFDFVAVFFMIPHHRLRINNILD